MRALPTASASGKLQPPDPGAAAHEPRSADGSRLPRPSAQEPEAVAAELKTCIGFTEQDAANLRRLAEPLAPFLPRVVARFYEVILSRAGTARVLERRPGRLERLRASLSDWLGALFSGRYDAAYAQQVARIGQVHVRVGLPQHYMFAGLEVIRQELRQAVREARVRRADAKLQSLYKLLALNAALMLESYTGRLAERVRERERSAVRQRLTQAEHLARIGQLAASLAHEIKNPLAGISGAIQVIRDGLGPGAPHRPILAEILRQINRLDQTVKDLLVYARPVPPRFGNCNLNRVVERVMTVLKREPAMQRVRFEHTTDHRPLPSIEADENQIEQLLMNLLLNAADASEDGGLVVLTTRPTATGVQLEVKDAGQGMDEETRRRALEPFFTTKSKGTGLGLPICQRIVAAHAGTLTIRSAEGVGTVVRVKLPQRQPLELREGR